MSKRTGLRAGAVAIACAAALVTAAVPAAAVPAAAAGAPRWRIVATFGAAFGFPSLGGGAAVSASQAWVVGEVSQSTSSMFAARWNGAKWAQVGGPPEVTNLSGGQSVSDGAVAASRGAMWTFPTVYSSKTHTYALRFAAGRWTSYALPDAFSIDAAVVFGPSDVLAFGQAVPPKPVLGFGPPYLARFDGHRWRRMPMPGVPIEVNALSRTDIWAFGPSARTAGNFNQTYIAMHWAGRRWTSMTLPRLRASGGKLAFPSGLAVLRGNSLWMTEQFHCPHPGCERPQPPGILLAHWNGKTWVRVLTSSRYEVPSPESDGHGGLWITALDTRSESIVYLRYAHGSLTRLQPPSTSAGTPVNVGLPIVIPGTNSAWGTGDIPLTAGGDAGAIFKFGP